MTSQTLQLWTMDFGLRTLDYGLWTMDFGLQTLNIGLWTSDFRLWTLDFGLWTMEHQAKGTPCFVVLLEYRSGHDSLNYKKVKIYAKFLAQCMYL